MPAGKAVHAAMVARAHALADSLRTVAVKIADGVLIPGAGAAFIDGKPVCAFGHAMAGVGYQWIQADINQAILSEYMNGGFYDIDNHRRNDLMMIASNIAAANDSAFSRNDLYVGQDAKLILLHYLQNASDKLDAIE